MGSITNPWQVLTLDEFLFYCCPECDVKSDSKQEFVIHAVDQHPSSHEYLLKAPRLIIKPVHSKKRKRCSEPEESTKLPKIEANEKFLEGNDDFEDMDNIDPLDTCFNDDETVILKQENSDFESADAVAIKPSETNIPQVIRRLDLFNKVHDTTGIRPGDRQSYVKAVKDVLFQEMFVFYQARGHGQVLSPDFKSDPTVNKLAKAFHAEVKRFWKDCHENLKIIRQKSWFAKPVDLSKVDFALLLSDKSAENTKNDICEVDEMEMKEEQSEAIEDIFLCAQCDSVFESKQALSVHVSKMHSESNSEESKSNEANSEQSSYPCFLCESSFTNLESMRKHMHESHRDSESFECPECDYTTNAFDDFCNHLTRKHQIGYHLYKCNQCQLNFGRVGMLRRHNKEWHSEGVSTDDFLPCPLCDVMSSVLNLCTLERT